MQGEQGPAHANISVQEPESTCCQICNPGSHSKSPSQQTINSQVKEEGDCTWAYPCPYLEPCGVRPEAITGLESYSRSYTDHGWLCSRQAQPLVSWLLYI